MNLKNVPFILKLLKDHLSEDSKALEAIAYLETRILELHDEMDDKCLEVESTDFPLPKEITHEASFALFSDGACRGNPGPGAWGMLAQDGSGMLIFEGSGVEARTTNNRMELQGAIESIRSLINHGRENGFNPTSNVYEVHLYSDSKYVVDGMRSWVKGWKARGWKKADKKAPENLELWQELDQLSESFASLRFHWVKGHAGHPQNERCDQLANMALDDSGYGV